MRKVLLLIESEDFRFGLRETLRNDFELLEARDAVDGALMLQAQPDILLLDLFLQGMNGLAFLETYRAYLPQTVVLFTTLCHDPLLQAAEALGVSAVYLKPCSLSSVRKYLKGLP